MKIPFLEILKTLGLFLLAFVLVIFAAKSVSHLFVEDGEGGEPHATTTVTVVEERPIVICEPNFLSYQALADNPANTVNLINERTSMYAENGEFRSRVVITKIETEKSKVACGYLLVRAGTGTNGPLQSWENLFINPNEFGGHINDDSNIGQGDGPSFSEYVFPLSKIGYWKTRNDRVKGNLLTADWGVLLNVSQTIAFEIGLNTNDPTGFIDKFSIAYKCWDPVTGVENNDCKIKVLE